MIARVIAAIVMMFISSAVFADPYDDAVKTVRVLSDSSYVQLLPFGKSHSNRTIPAFIISDFSSDCVEKARVLIVAGQHGDEPDPVKSVLGFCKSLTAGEHNDLLQKCMIIVVPMVNPDGVASSRRLNVVDADTNRDWIDLTTCETRFVHGIVKNWKPHLLIDVHNWNEPSFTPGTSIEIPYCDIGSHRDAMIAAARRAGDNASLHTIECRSASERSLFHRRYGALGYAAFLLETENGEQFAVRDRIYRAAILSLIESVANNTGARYVMSPTSMNFKPASVAVYLEPTPVKDQTGSSLYGPVLLGTAFIILACLMRPFTRKEKTAWSRRFIICDVDPELSSDRLTHKHVGYPITSRSWVNKRLRVKYAPIDENKDKPEPEEQDHSRNHPLPTADLKALFRETAETVG